MPITESTPETLRLERRERIAILTLDRPPLNILDLTTLEALDATVAELAADPQLQVVFLRAAGERAFSAGVAVEDHTPDRVERMLTTFHRSLLSLSEMPAVTVSVIHGFCLGGGMELALSCDLRLAAEDARFGQPEVDLGCFPPLGAALYPSLMGEARTLELLLTGRRLTAYEADLAGLLTWKVDRRDLDDKVEEIATQLTTKSLAVTRLIKKAIRAGRSRTFRDALVASEGIYLDELCATEDMQEGLDAFREKRPPQWKHR